MTTRSSSTSTSAKPSEPDAAPLARQRGGWRRRLGWLLAGLVALLLIAALGVYAAVQTPAGRSVLAALASRGLSAVSGFEVRIEQLAAGLPRRLAVGRITLADENGAWLSIDALDLRWQPLALLRGRLAIAELTAERVAVLRSPRAATPAADDAPASFAIPDLPQPLPLAVWLDRLQVERIVLGPALAGMAAELTLQGGAAVPATGRIRSWLEIRRLDGPPGTLAATATWAPAQRRLQLDARLSDGPHGLLAAVLGADPATVLQASLSGDGPPGDWRGALALEASGLAKGRTTIALALADASASLRLDGEAEWQGAAPEAMRPALAQPITFAGAWQLTAQQRLRIERAEVAAGGLALSTHGDVDLAQQQADVTAHLAAEAAALSAAAMAPLRLRAATASLGIRGPLAQPALTLTGEIIAPAVDGIRADRVALQASMTPDPAAAIDAPVPVALQAAVDGMTGLPEPAAALIGPRLALAVDGALDRRLERLQVQRLDATGAAIAVDGSAELGLAKGVSRADLVLSLADLAPLGAAARLPLAGRVELTAAVQGLLTEARFSGQLRARGAAISTGIAAADALLGAAPEAGVDIRFAPAAGLSVESLSVRGQAMTLAGNAAIDPGFARIDGRLSADLPSLRPLRPLLGDDAAGAVTATARLSGPLDDPTLDAEVNGRDIVAAGVPVDSATLKATLAQVATRSEGPLQLSLLTARGPAEVRARFARSAAVPASLSAIDAAGFGLRLQGAVAADAAGLLTGRIEGRATAQPAALSGRNPPLSGDGQAVLILDHRGGRQGVSIDLDATALTVAGDAGEVARLQALSLHGRIADATGAPAVQITARGDGVHLAGQPPADVDLSLQGPLSDMAIALAIDGEPDHIDRLSAVARVDLGGPVTTVRLVTVTGEVAGQPIVLQSPFSLRLQDGDIVSDELALGVGAGRLALRIERRMPAISGYAIAEALPLPLPAIQARRFPQSLALDGEVRFGTVAGLLDGTVRLQASTAGDGSGGALRLDGLLQSGRLSATAVLSGLAGVRAEATAALPLSIPAASLALTPDDSETLAGRLIVAADLAQLAALLALSDQRLTGRADADFSLSGRRSAPQIAGALQLTDAAVEDFLSGLRITGVSGRIAAPSPRQFTLSLTGGADPGTVAIDGAVQLDGPDGPAADLRLRAVDATVLRRDDITARLDADLAYRGGLGRGTISGSIRSNEINVRLVDRLPPSIVGLPVREINRPGSDDDGGGDAGGPVLQAALDLAVAMPARVFIRGRGLTSEWSGDLAISGRADDPRIRGTVSLVRGNVIIGGKRFDLASGRLTFTGGTPVDPFIDLTARYQTPTLIALITVSGPASEPRIEMTSQPPLPQSEVLSQVLFGKSAAKLGPVQALQLASALDTLARGESVGENVLDVTRTFLGLDVLTVGPAQGADGEQGAEVGVGRYLGDDIYIGATRGIGEANTTGTVEVEIVPGIAVESEVSQTTAGPTAGFGLRWRYDY